MNPQTYLMQQMTCTRRDPPLISSICERQQRSLAAVGRAQFTAIVFRVLHLLTEV